MGMKATRSVTLPGGTKALEIEETHLGGSETQASYTYVLENDETWGSIDKSKFKTDYWGRIEGCQYH